MDVVQTVNEPESAFDPIGYSESGMDCAECDRLRAECERLEHAYAAAINTLNSRVGNAPSFEYIELSTAVHDARINSEIAGTEFEQHRLVHKNDELNF